MRSEDLNLVSTLGQSLWAESDQSGAITRETVSAISYLENNPERAAEKAAQALLDRANQKGMYSKFSAGLNSLFPEERFILLALHSGHWSYERIARVVREPIEMVQSLAWNARVYLALSHYPVAPTQASASCPEYDPKRPWTQKFVDEEVSGQEKVFLTAHSSSCTSCREALMRTKDVYYRVQKQIDAQTLEVSNPGLTAQLGRLVSGGRRARTPSAASFGESMMTFLGRPEVRVILAIWAVGSVWLHFKH